MIKRYYYDGLGEDIYDSEIDDFPSTLTICETLNQQDRRIEELLKANDSFGMIGNIVMEYYGKKDLCAKDVEDYASHIKEQDHKIAVLERALELCICKLVDFEYENKESTHSATYWWDYFKSKAESDIKNEKE